MMKSLLKYFGFAAVALSATLTSCEGEKDLIIIEEDLPIKTSTLYMVGDATPNGWSIDAPTALTASDADPLIFTYEGKLTRGEFKLCLTTGSWDAPFIRPAENGTEISKSGLAAATFIMHAGDPDNKWKVVDEAIYKLTFNLRNWTAEFAYVSDVPKAPVTPIETEYLYMVGDATPNGWNIDAPTSLVKESQYIFTYEGKLTAGELKCCMTTADWGAEFIRPAADQIEINRDGVAESDFIKSTSPDNKWRVTAPGVYKLTFDLEHWTIAAQFLEELPEEPGGEDPEEINLVFAIGDALETTWSLDAAPELEKSADNKWVFKGQLNLNYGDLKFGTVKNFDAPFIHPTTSGCSISKSGVADNAIVQYAGAPDDKWRVNDPGVYNVTLDLQNLTIAVEYVGELPEKELVVYMVGDATPTGWNIDNPTALTKTADNVYTYEGKLKTGELKFCTETGSFGAEFIRPAENGTQVTKSGLPAAKYVKYAGDPDNKWVVADEGTYKVTVDLNAATVEFVYVK